MRILIIDHWGPGAAGTEWRRALETDGFALHGCEGDNDALFELRHSEFDAVLLMPSRTNDGLKPVRAIRDAGLRTPIMILSLESGLDIRVEAIRRGADEFLVWPCDVEELAVRLHALARRARRYATSVLQCGDIALDLDLRTAAAAGRELSLSAKEFLLLEALLMRKGATLGKSAILDYLYDGRDEPDDKIVDVYVCKLRKKIAEAGGNERRIETVWGRGYRMIDAEPADPRPAAPRSGAILCPITRSLYALDA